MVSNNLLKKGSLQFLNPYRESVSSRRAPLVASVLSIHLSKENANMRTTRTDRDPRSRGTSWSDLTQK